MLHRRARPLACAMILGIALLVFAPEGRPAAASPIVLRVGVIAPRPKG